MYSAGCGHRKSVCPSPQRRRALSSQASAMQEEVPFALAMSTATRPLPAAIHPQPPCCHRHPVPGGCRLDFRGGGQNLEAWRRPRVGVVGSDLISSQLIMGSRLGYQSSVQSSSPARPETEVEGDGWRRSHKHKLGPVVQDSILSQTLCTYCLSFFVQIMCSGTTWLMPLGGNFCHVVAACPKCRQNARVLGASLKGLLSNVEL